MARATATKVGDPAPGLDLPDTEGQVHALPMPGEAPATVVIWTCNHCPYALAWHERLARVARDYAARGVRFLAVNSNDAERYPRDSLEAMRERVGSEDWPFPYLHDESQRPHETGPPRRPRTSTCSTAICRSATRALRTPTTWTRPDAAWLRAALDEVLSGASSSRAETEPVGCSIKWKR